MSFLNGYLYFLLGVRDDKYCLFSFLYVQVIAERLSEEEIAGLKEMFKMIDADNSGTITFDELKTGLRKLGSSLMDTEIQTIMDAVSSPQIDTQARSKLVHIVRFEHR